MASKTAKVSVSLKITGKTYRATGKDLMSALEKLTPPVTVKAGVLTFTKGKIKKEKVLFPVVLNRAFRQQSPTMRQISLKKLAMLVE